MRLSLRVATAGSHCGLSLRLSLQTACHCEISMRAATAAVTAPVTAVVSQAVHCGCLISCHCMRLSLRLHSLPTVTAHMH